MFTASRASYCFFDGHTVVTPKSRLEDQGIHERIRKNHSQWGSGARFARARRMGRTHRFEIVINVKQNAMVFFTHLLSDLIHDHI